MARPKKDGLDYFPHDVHALTDPKLESAILRYGAYAYAFYFVHLEYCYKSKDLCIDISDTEAGMEMREVIQMKLQMPADVYDNVLKSLLRHGAFDAAEYEATGHLTSNGIKKRAAGVFKKRMYAASAYEQSKIEETVAKPSDEEEAEKAPSPAEMRDQERLAEARRVFTALPKQVRASVTQWIEYKKERREAYKPVSMLTLMRKVQESVNASCADAVVEVITDSIASRYSGITWDRMRQGSGKRSGTTNPFLDNDEGEDHD